MDLFFVLLICGVYLLYDRTYSCKKLRRDQECLAKAQVLGNLDRSVFVRNNYPCLALKAHKVRSSPKQTSQTELSPSLRFEKPVHVVKL